MAPIYKMDAVIETIAQLTLSPKDADDRKARKRLVFLFLDLGISKYSIARAINYFKRNDEPFST